jgi:hypothetical protein
MTSASTENPSGRSSTRIRLPAIAAVLFVVSPVLLALGALTFMGASYADYFERAPTQSAIGAGLFAMGIGCLLAASILAGVRQMMQQQTDLLLRGPAPSRGR